LLAVVALVGACDEQFHFDDPAGDAATEASASSACSSDTDCRLALHCDLASGECVACTDDPQCAAPTPRCDAALHRCVECGSDSDCAVDQICESQTRSCITTCSEATEKDCPSSAPTCDEDTDRCTRCATNSDCSASAEDGQFCNESNGQCVRCLVDSDCTDHDRPICDLVAAKCVGCITSSDCSDEKMCDPTMLECR
jgi:hypothetical protein